MAKRGHIICQQRAFNSSEKSATKSPMIDPTVGRIDFLGQDFYLKLSMPCKTRGFVDIKTTNKHVKTRKYTRVLVRQSHFFTSRRSGATRKFSRKPDRKPALSPALATIPEMTAVIIGYASVTNMVARSGHVCAQMNYRSHASSTASTLAET